MGASPIFSFPRKGTQKPTSFRLLRNHPLVSGLVGCWPLGDGNFARDISGNNQHGTAANGAGAVAAGHHGGLSSTLTAASSQYFNVANSAPIDVTAKYSISVWVYPTSASGTLRSILYKDYNANFAQYGILYNFPSAGQWRAQGSATLKDVNGDTLTLNAWNFLTTVFDGTNLTLYRNGVQVAQGSSACNTNGNALIIGGDLINGRYWNDPIADLRIYNRVLTLPEIGLLYAEPYAGLTAGIVPMIGYAGGGTTYNQNVFAASSPAATLIRQAGKSVAASSSPAGSLVRGTGKIVAASSSPAGSIQRQTAKAVAASTSPAGSVLRQVAKTMAAACSPAASVARGFAKTLTASCSPAGSLTAIKVILKALNASCTPVAGLARSIAKNVAASVTPPATVKRAMAKTLAGSVSPLAAISRLSTKTLSGAVTPVAALVRAIGKSLFASTTPGASITTNIGAVQPVGEIDPRFYFRAGKRRAKRGFGRGVR